MGKPLSVWEMWLSTNGIVADNPSKLDRCALFVAAFIAGVTTLAVQLVCTRVATQVFGTGTTTVSTAIGMSLLGLAAGSVIIGRLADRWTRPLSKLAVLFLLLAALGLLLAIFLRDFAWQVSSMFASEATDGSPTGLIAFAFAALFPINFLLGGTIPLLVSIDAANSKDVANAGRAFGPIYAAETLGAAIGALVTGFWSIQTIGLRNTMCLVAAICCIGNVICQLSGNRFAEAASNADPPETANAKTKVDKNRWVLLLVVALASCSSLAMEVIWQRLFVIVFGSDTHSLAITTAAFLIGVALGAIIAQAFYRWATNGTKVYGLILIGIACALLAATLTIFSWIQNEGSIVWITKLIIEYPVAARFLFAFSILIIPATAIGIGLPVAASIWIDQRSNLGTGVGQLYAAALAGNIIGVILSGYVLVPTFGLRGSSVLLSFLCLAGGLGLVLFETMSSRSKSSGSIPARLGQALMVAAVVCWVALAVHLLNRDANVGVYSDRSQWQVDFYQETAANTVSVISSRQDSDVRKMLIDGVSIGESGGGVDEKQQLLAHLPFLLRPGATEQEILTIGLGTGILAGELLENESVAKVCCVEISDAVIEAAELFSDLNDNALENSRLDLVQADGVKFLRSQNREFDVIVSDAKSRPGHAGNVNFFSRDYYQLCSERLSSDGMFVQWIALNTSTRATEIILRTFCDSFDYGHVAIAAPGSLFVIGSKSPLRLEKQHIDNYLTSPMAESLRQYAWNSYDDLLSMYWLDQHSLVQSRLSDIAINSFDQPLLESTALDSFHYSPQTTGNLQLRKLRNLIQFDQAGDIENSRWNSEPLSKLSDVEFANDLIKGRIAALEVIAGSIAYSERKDQWLDDAAEHYQQAGALLPGMTRQSLIAGDYRTIAANAKQAGDIDSEFSALANVDDLMCADADELFRMGEILVASDQTEKSLDFMFRAAKLAPEQPNFQAELGFGMLRLQRLNQAKSRFNKVLSTYPEHGLSMLGLGITLSRSNDVDEGNRLIQKAIQLQPDLSERFRQATDAFAN